MARTKNSAEAIRTKCSLADRLRQIRSELYGERGGPELARRLGIPVRTWYNYEIGVTVPAEVVLRLVELTSVDPLWLLHGREPKFRVNSVSADEDFGVEFPDMSVKTLLRVALRRLERSVKSAQTGVLAVEDGDDVPAEDPVALPHTDAIDSQGATTDRCMRVDGTDMVPIVADGAYAAYSDVEEPPADLDGQLVVAWVGDRTIVRWFQHSGTFAMLGAENPAASPATMLVRLDDEANPARFRRVLWINTRH